MIYVFLFVLILLSVFLLTNVVAVTEFKEKKFLLKIYLGKIKIFDIGKKKKSESCENKQPEHQGKKEKLTFKKLKFYLDIVSKAMADFKKIFKYFKKKIHSDEFELDISFGLSDAAETGIATGVIWSFIGFAYPVVDSVFNVKDPKISVNPEFNCEMLQLEYKGIYKLKIIHIIYIAIMVTKLILKYKKEITNGGV